MTLQTLVVERDDPDKDPIIQMGHEGEYGAEGNVWWAPGISHTAESSALAAVLFMLQRAASDNGGGVRVDVDALAYLAEWALAADEREAAAK